MRDDGPGSGPGDRLPAEARARTEATLARCRSVVAGGESSAARLSNPRPIVMSHGDGARFWDVDGKEYIDWGTGYGPLVFGHRPHRVTQAVTEQLESGGSLYTFAHELDYEAGRRVCAAVPGVDLVRFCNSGTEATMAALRLARAFTGKERYLKFESHYHGWSDVTAISTSPPLDQAGPESRPRPVRVKAGIPRFMEDGVIVGCYNDFDGTEALIREHRTALAAVIAEPIACNCGVIPPAPGWNSFLRRVTRENDVLLILDEVITGFRVALGGAQELYGVEADITTWGKALGGGIPGAAAFGGSREIMDVETRAEVLHAGTYAGNPMVLAAIVATLDILSDEREQVYDHLARIGDDVCRGLRTIFAEAGVPAQVNQVKGLWQVFFSAGPVTSVRQARASDAGLYLRFQQEMQDRGVYFHDDGSELWFSSTAHTDSDVAATLAAARESIAAARQG
jgi:glutamate-1-semialdehyde 2,1-aminomutase